MIKPHKKSKAAQIFQIPDAKDNFGLTRKEFDFFLDNIKRGDESLFIKVFNGHFKRSVVYIRNKFSISEQQAYDVCMDTLVDFRSKLKADKIKYGNLRYLFTKMAANMYLDNIREKVKVKDAVAVFMGEHYKQEIEDKEFLMLVNRAIESLDDGQKVFIRDIFYHSKQRDQILEEHNISYDTFRKRKQRALEKLKSVLMDLLNKRKLK